VISPWRAIMKMARRGCLKTSLFRLSPWQLHRIEPLFRCSD
jgi:hypothetical protein